MKTKLLLLGLLALTLTTTSAEAAPDIQCTLSLSRLDTKEILVVENRNQNIALKPMNQGNDRSQGTIQTDFTDGYAAVVTATVAPGQSSLEKGADLIALSARLQRTETDGKITVLALGLAASDEISSLAELDVRKLFALSAHLNLQNPEIATAGANYPKRMSEYELVKNGLVPNGIASHLQVTCLRANSK